MASTPIQATPLPSDAAGDPESPIRVVVTPSQSAYFAGETLSVTITFTNTRTRSPTEGLAEPGPSSSRPSSRSINTHKRASHSVSSAPIARPPTSPAGLYRPRTPTTATPPGSPVPNVQGPSGLTLDGTHTRRRGLIGKNVGSKKTSSVPDLVEQRRKKMLTKSLSLSISANGSEMDNGLDVEDPKSASHTQRSFTVDSYLPPSSPRVSSPLARSGTLPLPSKHPHVRKQSVIDGTQFPYPTSSPMLNGNDLSISPVSPSSATSAWSISTTLASTVSPNSGPPTPSASASTSSFSLVLDPIAEVSPNIPPQTHPYLTSVPASASASTSVLGPALSSPSIAIEAPSPPSASSGQPPPLSSKPTTNRQIHRPPKIGLGRPTPQMFLNLERTNAELILYSYAQLKGTVTLTPLPSNLPSSSLSSKSMVSPRIPAKSNYPSSPSPLHPSPLSASQIEAQKAQTLAALRYSLIKGSATAVGGGSMDITSRTHSRTPSAAGSARLGGGLGSGSWGGSFSGGGNIAAAAGGLVPAYVYGPSSAYSSLQTIDSGSTEGPTVPPPPPSSARRPQLHSRTSSFSSGLLSIFGSPFGFGGSDSGPASAPIVTHPNNLAASVSAPNIVSPPPPPPPPPPHSADTSTSIPGLYNTHHSHPYRPTRNRAASAGIVPSYTSGWPTSPSSLNHSVPVSAGFEPPAPFGSSLSAPLSPGSGTKLGLGLGWPVGSVSGLGVGGSSSMGVIDEVDPGLPLPTFEAQSVMLAVDASLEPGESRSYEYSILLPSNLPPTFRGRTFRFAYELVVGICRAGNAGASTGGSSGATMAGRKGGAGPGGSVSKVMKVPIRVYTNVIVGRPPTPYDLLWPITKRRLPAILGHRRGGRMSSLKKGGTIAGAGDKDDPFTGRVVEITRSSSSEKRKSGTGARTVRQDRMMTTVVSHSSSTSDESSKTTAAAATSGPGSLTGLKDYVKQLIEEVPLDLNPEKVQGPTTTTLKAVPECELLEESPESVETDWVSSTGSGSGSTMSIPPSPSVSASSSSVSGAKSGLSPLLEEHTFSSPGEAGASVGSGGEGSGEAIEESKPSKEKAERSGLGHEDALPANAGLPRIRHTSTADLALKEKERIARLRQREESEEPMLAVGCGEAVEILTRNTKKVSYDVNKDGVKVAVLTFIKSAFRLGETIHGVVELNERIGRARVVQLSVHLETHEALPYPISTTPNTSSASRQLKRVHVEHHSNFVLSTLRTTFALDIPSDASPAFQFKVGDDADHVIDGMQPKPKLEGGLEWKVRLCLLVAVANESSDSGAEGVRFKSLVRDGPRGEWGSVWKAPVDVAPCEKQVGVSSSAASSPQIPRQQQGVVQSWTSFLAASLLGNAEDYNDSAGRHHDDDGYPDDEDGDDGESAFPHGARSRSTKYDGIKPDHAGGVGIGVDFSGGKETRWQSVKLETVECEVPVRVWPGNTAFRPVDVVFDV
ncbi:hypothetical protein D9757_006750 [Collybiopsis confluens]|uniref:Rgp1-domain-containing protein n=1 Tax=Collybiopsis confluens TaxID=2823264 RepID=A0A8H5HLJ2_9AGAR|nr:hypothetical protein D9757_006750 [Collybiopsis confluens]